MRSRRSAQPATARIRGIISACAEQTNSFPHTSHSARDHLRVCGADDIVEASDSADKGSSPRVRSRRVRSAGRTDAERIISACAEQTALMASEMFSRRDHLRVCGADARMTQRPQLGGGGIISACAEQTVRSSRPSDPTGDHLRVCGADRSEVDACVSELGSSPRVRSRLLHQGPEGRVVGIISACAEQTRSCTSSRTWRRDHLRVCGADLRRAWPPAHWAGSSPRVRSRRKGIGIDSPAGGIISACAEQTSTRSPWCCRGWDHLRVCGADSGVLSSSTRRHGSSPRVRSRPPCRLCKSRRGGIISACAEQTRPRPQTANGNRDHLRVCGADPAIVTGIGHLRGSSPRVRSRLPRPART